MDNSLNTYQGIFYVQQYNEAGEIEDYSYAINPEINRSTQRATWRDGGRGRLVDYDKLSDCTIEFQAPATGELIKKNLNPTRIRIVNERDHRVFLLEPLTLDKYRLLIKNRIAGHPEFTSEKEMINFFLNL